MAEARALTSSAGRARRGRFLLEGAEAVGWALESGVAIERIFFDSSPRGSHHDGAAAEEVAAVVRITGELGIPRHPVSGGLLKKISGTSYVIPVVGVARVLTHEGASRDAGDLVVVLDRVRDHGNLGTIVRTARAFGVGDFFSTEPGTDLYYKKVISASRGAVFGARLFGFSSGASAVRALQDRGYQVVATSPRGGELQALAPLENKPVAVVVGNETEGVCEEVLELCDAVVQIPMGRSVESLNVGVSAGISLYELKIRMVLSMLTDYIRATLGREVNVTGMLMKRAFDAELAKVSDLGSARVILMMIMRCDRVMTLDQISKDTATFGEELTQLLGPLFERGYVRSVSPEAEGAPAQEGGVELTGTGERVLGQLWSVVERAEDEALAGFSEREKEELGGMLGRVQANCLRVIGE